MNFAFIKAFSLLMTGSGKEICCTKPSVKSSDSRPAMVTCGPKNPCPRGTMCLKMFGNEGLCVLTK